MSEESAKTTLQETPSLLQDMSKIPPMAWVITVILAMTAVGVLPWMGAVSLVFLAWVGLSRIEAAQALKDAKARAATYANCIGPIVVSSIHPNETLIELEARANDWREKLRLSGNPYAEKIPIITYPYNVMLVEHGQLTAGWSTYQRNVGETQHMENLKWYEGKCPSELKSLFASAVLPAPKQEFQNHN